MAMAMRQARRQLQFTGFEMALIAVSFLITVTTVFFLGLFVGKKNASFHAPTEDRVARIPVDDFTRYKRPAPIPKAPPKEAPAETEVASAAPAASAPAAAPSAAAAKAPAASVPAKPAAPAVAAEPMGPEPAPVAVAKVPADAVAADAAVTADAAAKAKEAAAKDAAAKELAAKEAAAKEAARKKEEAAAAEETGRGYTVQILATRKQAEADALVKKLKSRGFGAYIKTIRDGEGAWYRVRVGSYGAFSEARSMADKCRRDLGLGQAFVSTE